MLPNLWRSLAIAALGLVVLPFALGAVGLTLTSAIDVVVFAVAAMGLNILVGYTGLVSFGHGTWFGLAAVWAVMSGLLILRTRRGSGARPERAPARPTD